MRVLVTGGAGYIGSHTVRHLVRQGAEVEVLDDLSAGHAEAVPQGVRIHEACLVQDRLEPILSEARPDAVIHFAGRALVGESVRRPAAYWETNALGGLRLLEAMRRTGVTRIVFSSTCATYGIPDKAPIAESCPQRPINPYGRTKLAFEHALADHASAYGFAAVALRYFNAAGAEADGTHGEDHEPETHLIPLVLRAARDGRSFRIFGTDYPTRDGTCIRDFIHVDDLARAHALAIERARAGHFLALNLGTGSGHTVREVMALAQSITGKPVRAEESARRQGDPPALVAETTQAERRLGFKAERGLEDILRTAWVWHRDHPHGYGAAPPAGEESFTLRFGELARELGLITREQLEDGLKAQREARERGDGHKLLGLVLLEQGALGTDELIRVLRTYEARRAAVTAGAAP